MHQGFQKNKSLIVCYSCSGNTWKVAEEIRRQTGAPLCEIYPKQPYPMNFESMVAKVREEIATGTLPRLLPIGEKVEDYDTIYIGTPNWCGTMAPPMRSFLAGNDLKGKVLRPFSTHCGMGDGEVERDIRSACPEATVGPCLSIVGDGADMLTKRVSAWLNG